MSRTFLAAALAACLVSPAYAGLSASDERPVAPVAVVARGGAAPVIAAAGSDALVAWSDARGIETSVISAPGVVAPKPSRRVRSAPGVTNVSLAATGSAYLMTWIEGSDVMAATLGRDGGMNGQPHLVATNAAVYPASSLAWNGSHALLVLWPAATHSATGVLLDRDGNVVASNLGIGGAATNATTVIAANGIFYVCWVTTRSVTAALTPPPPSTIESTIHIARIDDRGTLLDPFGATIDITGQIAGGVAMAFDGRSIALSLLAAHAADPQKLHRWLIDPGTLNALALPDIDSSGFASGIVRSGSAFIAYWSSYDTAAYRLMTVAFTGAEAVTANAIANGLRPATDLTAAAAGPNVYLLWTDRAAGGEDGMAIAVEPGGTRSTSEPFNVAFNRQPEAAPAIAPGLVLWCDASAAAGSGELYASRLDADGVEVGSPIRLSTSGIVQPPPRVVFTGSMWFVAWTEEVGTQAPRGMIRRIALDGSLLDPAPVQFAMTSFGGSPAFNGSTILLPYASIADSGDLVAAQFDRNGVLLRKTTVAAKAFAWDAAASSNGRDFLLTWTVGSDWWQFPSPNMLDVVGARVNADGTLLDGTPFNIASGPADQVAAVVASNGREYLVAYFETFQPALSIVYQLKVQRVSADGFPDGAPIDVGDLAEATNVSLTGNADGYWLAWTAGTYANPSARIAHLDGNGNVLDTAQVSSSIDGSPQVVANGAAADVAYARYDDATGAIRVFTRRYWVTRGHGRAAGR